MSEPSGRSSGVAIGATPERTRRRSGILRGPWQIVAVLSALYLIGTIDRQMSALLLTPIKQDLRLSDVQVSLIQGMAFALAYVLASIPVGWMVDRFSRRRILFGGALVWGTSATASGFAGSFGQLFLARTGVGAGEATIHPSCFSIMADLFPPHRLALPLTLFTLGGTIGSGLSFIVGGWIVGWIEETAINLPILADMKGWQVAFVLTGLPALLLGSAAVLIQEPQRTGRTQVVPGGRGYRELWRHYARHPLFYGLHMLAFSMPMAWIVGLGAWNPTFLGRIHGWDLDTIGLWLGATQIASGLLGLGLHGWLIDRWFGRGRTDAHMRYFAIMSLIAAPLGGTAYLVESAWLALLLINAAVFCLMSYPGIGPASLQIATPPLLRGKASAVYLIWVNLIGTIGGPLAVAMLTDYFFRDEQALGYSMSLFSVACALAGVALFTLGMKPMRAAVSAR